MLVTAFFLLVSIIGTVVAMSQPVWGDLVLVAAPCAIASAILLYRETRSWLARDQNSEAEPAVVVDGSNVMYWLDGTPLIQPVQDVVRHLSKLGFRVVVLFDANAGHLIAGRYKSGKALAEVLGLQTHQVTVVDKGTSADPSILKAARDLGALIVTNDRFRDWVADYPEILTSGQLIKGGYYKGKLWIEDEALTLRRSAA